MKSLRFALILLALAFTSPAIAQSAPVCTDGSGYAQIVETAKQNGLTVVVLAQGAEAQKVADYINAVNPGIEPFQADLMIYVQFPDNEGRINVGFVKDGCVVKVFGNVPKDAVIHDVEKVIGRRS